MHYRNYLFLKSPFFIDFEKHYGPINGLTNQPINQQTDKASYRDARTPLKKGLTTFTMQVAVVIDPYKSIISLIEDALLTQKSS